MAMKQNETKSKAKQKQKNKKTKKQKGQHNANIIDEYRGQKREEEALNLPLFQARDDIRQEDDGDVRTSSGFALLILNKIKYKNK